MLQKKFNDFKSDTQASSEMYTVANNLARKLVAEGHSDTVFIKEKQDAMRYISILYTYIMYYKYICFTYIHICKSE